MLVSISIPHPSSYKDLCLGRHTDLGFGLVLVVILRFTWLTLSTVVQIVTLESYYEIWDF